MTKQFFASAGLPGIVRLLFAVKLYNFTNCVRHLTFGFSYGGSVRPKLFALGLVALSVLFGWGLVQISEDLDSFVNTEVAWYWMPLALTSSVSLAVFVLDQRPGFRRRLTNALNSLVLLSCGWLTMLLFLASLRAFG